jgi:hypothetical protein
VEAPNSSEASEVGGTRGEAGWEGWSREGEKERDGRAALVEGTSGWLHDEIGPTGEREPRARRSESLDAGGKRGLRRVKWEEDRRGKPNTGECGENRGVKGQSGGRRTVRE